jgi:uncharacterized protein (DUF305 family)
MFKKITVLFIVLLSSASASSAVATSHGKTLSNLNGNDIMFAQMMIPHHQQAIQMSKYALKNSTNMEIKKIASAISSGQGSEISQMKYWLSATKSSATMGHGMGHGMDMNGMISESQMRTLSALKGAKFDKAFLLAMIEHHQGALEMVTLLKGTKNSEAKKLATDITRVQKAEIVAMKKLLVKLA